MSFKNLLFLTLAVPLLFGCGYLRIDPWNVLIRSDVITTAEKEREVLAKAKLTWTDDGAIRVLHVAGTPYERGYQHGVLLRKEVQDNLGYMYERAIEVYHSKEIFAEAYERLRPFISAEYIEEMHGLAHGSKMPLETIHAIHALPSMSEWGGKKLLKGVVQKMMAGEDLGTSCSNLSAANTASVDGNLYVVRILDWGLHRISKLHEYPLLTVSHPDIGIPSVNVGWVGFLGAVSGMNAEGITLGEMGYRDPPNETLRGEPMVFLLRDVLSQAKTLSDARSILKNAVGECSYVFLISDGKTKQAEMYIKDPDRFDIYHPGEDFEDGEIRLRGHKDLIYGGHFSELMGSELAASAGRISPETIMQEFVPKFAMPSNFHNVVYDPANLRIWVNNAKSAKERAAEQPYTFFDLGAALKDRAN